MRRNITIPVLLLLAAVSSWAQSQNSKDGYNIPAGKVYAIDGVPIGSALTACTSSTANDTYQATCTPEFSAPPSDGDFIKFKATAAANTGAASITFTGPDPDAGPYPIYRNADTVDLDDNQVNIDVTDLLRFCAACNSAAGAFIVTVPVDSDPAPASTYESGGADPISAANMDDLGLIPHDTFGELTDNDHPQYPCLGCASSELTLDTNGDITIPAGGGVFSLDTFADAATDTLDTIACTAGNSFILRAENVARVVTILASAIPIKGGVNFSFNEANDRAWGICPAINTPIILGTFDVSGGLLGKSLCISPDGTGTDCNYDIRTQWIDIEIFDRGTTVATGDQQKCFLVPGTDDCTLNPTWCTANGALNLTHVGVMLGNNAGTATGMSIQISRKRLSAPDTKGTVDTLSTPLTTDAGEFSSADDAQQAVVNTSNDDAAPGDEFCVDNDAVPTGAEGQTVWMRFAP